ILRCGAFLVADDASALIVDPTKACAVFIFIDAVPTTRITVQLTAIRIIVLLSLLPNYRQGRCDLKINDQKQLVLDLYKPGGSNRPKLLFEALVILSEKLRALLMVIERSLDQFVRFFVRHRSIGAGVLLNVIAPQIVYLGELVIKVTVDRPELLSVLDI